MKQGPVYVETKGAKMRVEIEGANAEFATVSLSGVSRTFHAILDEKARRHLAAYLVAGLRHNSHAGSMVDQLLCMEPVDPDVSQTMRQAHPVFATPEALARWNAALPRTETGIPVLDRTDDANRAAYTADETLPEAEKLDAERLLKGQPSVDY